MTLLDDTQALSRQLDEACYSLADQAQMCFAIATAAIKIMPAAERQRHLRAHLHALADAVGADFHQAVAGHRGRGRRQ